jgi:hypothetical protein
MKKTVLLAAVVSIWSFAAAFAANEQPGKEPAQKPEPNTSPAPAVMPAFQHQRPEMEQMREQARQRIRERTEQRRRQALRGGAVDMNRVRVDANSAGGVADANAAKRREAAIERLLLQQEAKYRERLSRLNRIRELAKEQGDVNTVEKVDKLIKQDVQLHQVKKQRMSHQKEMIGVGRSRLPGAPRDNLIRIVKVKEVNVPDANKNVARPPLKKRP